MAKPKSKSEDGRIDGFKSSFKPLTIPGRRSADGMRLLDATTQRSTVTGLTPFLGNNMVYDRGDNRIAIHYARMPYAHRDWYVAKQRDLYRYFDGVGDAHDQDELMRKMHMRLIGALGLTSTDSYTTVASAHVQIASSARMVINWTVAQAAMLMNLGRTYGPRWSNDIRRTLKMTNWANVLGVLLNLPFDKDVVTAIIKGHPMLTKKEDQSGSFVSFPLLLPLGCAYVDDQTGFLYAETATEKWDCVVPTVGRGASAAGVKSALLNTFYHDASTSAVGHYLASSRNRMADHLLSQIQMYLDYIASNFLGSAANNLLNLAQARNDVVSLWQAHGLIGQDRVKEGTVTEFASMLQDGLTDLDAFVAQNFGFASTISPVIRGGQARTSVSNIMGFKFNLKFDGTGTIDQLTSVMAEKLPATAVSESSYVGFKSVVGKELDFYDCRDLSTADVASAGLPAHATAMVQANSSNLLISGMRFIAPTKAGEFAKRMLSQPGVFQIDTIRSRAQNFMPMYMVTPMYDPNDPKIHGFHVLMDMKALTEDSAVADRMPNAWEELIRLSGFLGAHANKWTAAKAVTCPALPEFIGDAYNVPPFLHVTRPDIQPLDSYGLSVRPVVESDDESWLIYDKSTRRITPALKTFAVTMDIGNTAVSAVVTAALPVLAEVDLAGGASLTSSSMAMRNYLPHNFPTVSRMNTEYTENGVYAFGNQAYIDVVSLGESEFPGKTASRAVGKKGQSNDERAKATTGEAKAEQKQANRSKSKPTPRWVDKSNDRYQRRDDKVNTPEEMVGDLDKLGSDKRVPGGQAVKGGWDDPETNKVGKRKR